MLHLLVESKFGATLLSKLLNVELQAGSVFIKASAPPSSLHASARTLLIMRKVPVALVLGTKSTEEGTEADERQSVEEVIGGAAAAAPFRIFMTAPSLEALLFRRPEAVERLYGPLTPEQIEFGQYVPQKALAKLEPGLTWREVSFKILTQLDDADVAALRSESPISELLDFLGELKRDGALAVATAGA